MQLYKVLKIMPIIETKNKLFHLFWNKCSLLFVYETKSDISNKMPPMGNAEGRKNIPIKKK